MLNFLFEQIIIFCQKKILIRFTRQKQIIPALPIKVTGAFLTGLCLSLLFAACTANNATNTTAVSANNSNPTKASVVRIGYQKSAFSPKNQ